MLLYGLCPAHEDVTLVVCNECGRVVKTVAFQRHCGNVFDVVVVFPFLIVVKSFYKTGFR